MYPGTRHAQFQMPKIVWPLSMDLLYTRQEKEAFC